MSRWRAHHQTQEHGNWCVLGCIAIVRSRGGGAPANQQALASKLFGGKAGYSLEHALSEFGAKAFFQRPNPDSVGTIEWIDLQLRSGAWIACLVYGAELAHWMSRAGVALQGPHGALSGVLHCIVLVESTERGILYLDPYFTADGQPICLPRTELARVLQSTLVVVPA